VARRLLTSSMASRDYDVITVTSQYSKLSHSELGPGSTICVDCGPFKHALSYNIVLKNQVIQQRTLGEKAFVATAVWPKFATFHDVSNGPCFTACSV